MYFESVGQNIELLDRDKFDFITRFHDHVRNENGLIDENFSMYFPHLTLCQYQDMPVVSPRIIHSGSKSGTRRVFGESWANNLPEYRGTPDLNLEELATPGYQNAASVGFSCDLVETCVDLPRGAQLLTFIRYIAKLETHSGIKFFGLAGTVLNHTLQ